MSAGDSGERPDALALLVEARRSLQADVLPALRGETRFAALMIANALGIAARELESGAAARETFEAGLRALLRDDESAPGALSRRLVSEIRAGQWDGKERLHELLLRQVTTRLLVTNPKALADES